MIGKRTFAGLAALALAAGAMGSTVPAASAASVNLSFSVPGMYGYPPPGSRSCWRWSHWQHQWVWACHQDHPQITFDAHAHKWNDHRNN